jgi:hypothetical protein
MEVIDIHRKSFPMATTTRVKKANVLTLCGAGVSDESSCFNGESFEISALFADDIDMDDEERKEVKIINPSAKS